MLHKNTLKQLLSLLAITGMSFCTLTLVGCGANEDESPIEETIEETGDSFEEVTD